MLVEEESAEMAADPHGVTAARVQFGLMVKGTEAVEPLPLGITEKEAVRSLANSNALRGGRGLQKRVLAVRTVTPWEAL